jgi:hypothetical protein
MDYVFTNHIRIKSQDKKILNGIKSRESIIKVSSKNNLAILRNEKLGGMRIRFEKYCE